MSYYDPQTAKKVYLYRNGTVNADAKLLVVNDRQVRDFSSFLNRVTSGIRAPVAVRNIYTPMHGHKIRSLGELESGRYYVAGGSEHFKKVKYGSGPKLLPRRQQRLEVPPPSLPPSHMIVAESRYKRPVEKPFVIHVFRNGDELFHGVRVLLPRRVTASWDHILEIVTEKADLYTPAKKLCTLDGEVVTQLQDGGKYVAVEGSKPFRRIAYCATHIATVRRKRTSTLTWTLPGMTRRMPKPRAGRARPSLPPLPLSNTAPIPRPQPPPVDPTATLLVPPRRKVRPMAGRRNKEARERALLENRDDSVFGGSPVMQRHPRMPSPPPSASITNLHRVHLQTNRREPGEGKGRGHVANFRGNDNNDVMNPPPPLFLGGAHDSKEKDVVIRIGEKLETAPKTEVTISVQDSDLTLSPPPGPAATEDSLEEDADQSREASTDVLGAHITTQQNVALEGGQNEVARTEIPNDEAKNEVSNQGGQNEISNQGGQNEVSDQGGQSEVSDQGGQNEISNQGGQNEVPQEGVSRGQSQRTTPTAEAKIHVPPEASQSNTPPEGAQNSAPTKVGPVIARSQSQLSSTSRGSDIPSSKRESRGRGRSGRKPRSKQQKRNQKSADIGRKVGEGGETSISENIPDEVEVEEEINISKPPDNKETSQPELPTEEVPEEEGVATERSEVKEEAEEPKMKLQEQEVELVSETPTTNIDLTMTRNHQDPLVNANDRGEENLPLETETLATTSKNNGAETGAAGGDGESEGKNNIIAKEDGLTPPTLDSQATPPTPPTNDDNEHVLIVEDSPQ